MKRLAAFARSTVKMFLGSRGSRNSLRRGQYQAAHPEAGIRKLFDAKAAEDPELAEQPIFILSAGWRSGSTLLQRLVCSGGDVLIWGEPYDRSNLLQSLTRSLAPFSDVWPPAGYLQPSADLQALSASWTANLYPPPAALRAAYRGFLLGLFAKPARDLGAARWGFKEVRLGHAEAVLLQALFPRGRFLFIRRQLPEAYLSYRGFSGGMGWYASWPGAPVFTPFAFARNWARMTQEVELAARATGGMLIEYEDLIAGRVDLVRLSDYCGVAIRDITLERRIGSGMKPGAAKTLTRRERALLWLGLATAGIGRTGQGQPSRKP